MLGLQYHQCQVKHKDNYKIDYNLKIFPKHSVQSSKMKTVFFLNSKNIYISKNKIFQLT